MERDCISKSSSRTQCLPLLRNSLPCWRRTKRQVSSRLEKFQLKNTFITWQKVTLATRSSAISILDAFVALYRFTRDQDRILRLTSTFDSRRRHCEQTMFCQTLVRTWSIAGKIMNDKRHQQRLLQACALSVSLLPLKREWETQLGGLRCGSTCLREFLRFAQNRRDTLPCWQGSTLSLAK